MLMVQKKKWKVTISVFWKAIINAVTVRTIMMTSFGFNAVLLKNKFLT